MSFSRGRSLSAGVMGVREPDGVTEETDKGVGGIPRISEIAAADLVARRLAACMRARWLGKVVSTRFRNYQAKNVRHRATLWLSKRNGCDIGGWG